jgi:hypothetical protein
MSGRETQAVTYTDQDGRYELLGCLKAPPKTGVKSYTVTAQPQNGQLYFAAWDGADETQGLDAVVVDFNLMGGIELRGRVTDQATGKPLRRAVVEYWPLFPNVHVGKIPDYPGSKDAALSSAVTGPDGSYRLAALPGPGVVGVKAWPQDSYAYGLVTPKQLADLFHDGQDHGNVGMLYVAHVRARGAILQENYSSLTLINLEEKTAFLSCDIALAPAHTLRGTVLGPDGKPLAGVTVMGLESTGGYPETLASADFLVRRVTPGRTRELVFEHKERGLGKFVTVPGDRAEPLIVQLEPYGSVKGRLVGRDNQPVPGNKLRLGRSGFVHDELPNLTDQEGRFRIDRLIPGQKYDLLSFREALGWGVNFTAASGKSKDLGDLRPAR